MRREQWHIGILIMACSVDTYLISLDFPNPVTRERIVRTYLEWLYFFLPFLLYIEGNWLCL